MSQVRAEALAAALERGVPPIVWIHGDEWLIVQECAQDVRNALQTRGFSDRKIFEAGRNFDIDALAAEAGAMSLFADRRLIELRLGGTRATREIGQALAQVAAGLDESTRLLVTGARLDRTQLASAWFRAIDDAGFVVVVWPVDRDRLPQWIAARLARQQQRADRATLEWIATHVEGNLLAAHQEITKLGLLCPPGMLTPDAVREAVLDVARHDPFDLVDAVQTADVVRAVRTLDGLHAEGVAEPLVLWALAELLRNLVRLHEACAGGLAPGQAVQRMRLPPRRQQGYAKALARIDAGTARDALQEAARIDRMIKGLAPGNAWQAIETLSCRLAGAPLAAEYVP